MTVTYRVRCATHGWSGYRMDGECGCYDEWATACRPDAPGPGCGRGIAWPCPESKRTEGACSVRVVHRRGRTAEERFWGWVDYTESCWLWTGAKTPDGYGVASWDGRSARAHRVAYELKVGPIPAGLTIDHLCRVRHCVNPAHLEVVTGRENILRGTGPAALAVRKTHCPQGHPYDAANTHVYKGTRRCRICMRENVRQRRARSRALAAPSPGSGEDGGDGR